MTAPKTIHISESESLDLHDFCEQQAEKFTEEYKSIPLYFTTACILHFIDACSGDGELKESLTEEEIIVAKSVCQLLARSAEIEASKHLATEEMKDIADAINAPGLIPEPEQTIEPVEEPEATLEPATPQGSPLQDAYNASIASQKASKGRLTVVPPKEVGEEDRAIVDAATSSRLDSTYGDIRNVFTLNADMSVVTINEGSTPTNEDYARLLGLGFDLGRRSLWLMGEGIHALLKAGKDDAVQMIADHFSFSYSHASNWARVVDRVSAEQRQGLLPSVCCEIASRSYSDDPAANQAIIDATLEQAREEKWSCLEARSHAKMLQGKDEEINEGKESLKDKVKRLEKALDDIVKMDGSGARGEWQTLVSVRDIARKALGLPEVQQELVQP